MALNGRISPSPTSAETSHLETTRYRGFTREAYAQSKSDQVHESLPAYVKALHTRMMTKVRERLDDVIMDRQACFKLADDEMLVVKIRPIDLIPFAKGVPNGRATKRRSGPELRDFAIWHSE